MVSPARADDLLPAAVASALTRAGIPESAVGLSVVPLDASPPGDVVDDGGMRAGPRSASAARAQRSPVRAGSSATAPWIALHADRGMSPASTIKLVTTYAALELLGPAHVWKTTAASGAPLVGDVLDGDLVLKGSGDPKFVVESLWLMLRQLRQRGVRTIRGDLVIDRSAFEPAPYDPGAFDNEPNRPYNVGPDALLVNYKAIALRFVPDDGRRIVRVAMEPLLADFAVAPPAYVDGACGDWRAKLVPDFSRPDRIGFAGGYAGACGEQTWNVAVLDPIAYDGALFRSLWSELGGSLAGGVHEGVQPRDAQVLVERESPSLAEVVRDINKYSNNVMARELFLATAAEVTKQPASVERARRVVRSFYDGRGIAMPELVLDNGSGLSRSDRISAQSMTSLLRSAWASPVMPEFIASLPLVGYDGTMRRRLAAKTVAGQAHIKTGTLQDVRAIAGYVLASSGRRYALCFLVNHPNAGAAQAAQDALLQWVYERG